MPAALDRPQLGISVPSFPESLPVLTELCEAFIAQAPRLPPQAHLLLRLSVAEACRNAISQPFVAGRLSLVSCRLLGSMRDDPEDLAVEVTDAGAGFAVGGYTPPYRPFQIGTQGRIHALMSQEIIATIESPTTVSLTACDCPDDCVEPANHSQRGLGLLALCRCWRVVVFCYDPATGTTLRLSGPIYQANG